ncbi:XrtX-associated membrane protein [Hymenobacter glaciei]|uniref:XrtX-associated membrane protein n=1 Tax=Hymenobacter glaciei TaxID=877209 RepID=UPI0031E85913
MPAPRQPSGPARWLVAGGLVLALLLLGVYNHQVLDVLTAGWQRGLAALGLANAANAMQHGIDAGITRRMLPAVATYAALYLSCCLLLLHLLLTPAQWQLTWRLYAGALAAYVLIAVIGKLAGNAQWAYRLSRHLLDFVVSPLPVAGLYVLFRAGFGPAAERDLAE